MIYFILMYVKRAQSNTLKEEALMANNPLSEVIEDCTVLGIGEVLY